jgi:hypothetical protein
VLKVNYISNVIEWPESDGDGKLKGGWVEARANLRILLLDVKRIEKVYAFGGLLYVVYNAEDVDKYADFTTPLPDFAVELEHYIYEERTRDVACDCARKCECVGRIYRLHVGAPNEVEQFIAKTLRVDVEPNKERVSLAARPLNFTLMPVNITLYTKQVAGIAIAENPEFYLGSIAPEMYDIIKYSGKYIVVYGSDGYTLFRYKGEPNLSRLQGLRQ